MKITDLRVHILETQKFPSRPHQMSWGLVRAFTDEGIEGISLVNSTTAEELARRFAVSKHELIGTDPFDREKIEKLWSLYPYQFNPLNNGILCAIDVCLWDIAGKYFKLPIYKLIGAYREKVLAYASTQHYEKDEDYIEISLKCQKKGYRAIKIHPYQNWKKDIALCKAVREAVGDDMILLLDPVNAYDREAAIKVGREIEKLNFFTYEDPIPSTDIDGLVNLCRSLEIQVLIGERITSLYGYGEYIMRNAADALRCIDENVGGITPMLKIAHLAEAFGMKCEPHSWGHTLTQAAHLHVMLTIKNCDFFELPVPEGIFDFGMKDSIRIDKDGYVQAPKKPGLGYDIDWDEVGKITIKTLPSEH